MAQFGKHIMVEDRGKLHVSCFSTAGAILDNVFTSIRWAARRGLRVFSSETLYRSLFHRKLRQLYFRRDNSCKYSSGQNMTSTVRNFSLIRFALLCAIALFSTVMAACGGGGGSVGIASGAALFTSAPSAISIGTGAGGAMSYTIGGGTPIYLATSSNASVATATVGDTTLSISGVAAGTAQITVSDAKGATVTIGVTVSSSALALAISPSTFLVGENDTSPIYLKISGGTNAYQAFTSDPTVSSVSIAGSTLTVAPGSTGTRCITPVTSSGTYIASGTYDVTITVLDSLGASATSIMTIKDNGAGINTGCP